MHAPGSSATTGVVIFLLCTSSAVTYPTMSTEHRVTDAPKKCCLVGYAFNENLECVHMEPDKFNYATHNARQTMATPRSQIVTVITSVQGLLNCRDNADASYRHFLRTYAPLSSGKYCVEKMINGTTVLAECPDKEDSPSMTLLTRVKMETTTTTTITTVNDMTTITTTITTTASSTSISTSTSTSAANASNVSRRENGGEIVHHINDLRTVVFWGAQTYMDTNVAHVGLCIIVVVVYLSVPELTKSIYNRAVLRHNICLLLQGCILTLLGYCDLNEYPLSDNLAIFLWITLQYFTNATGFWLNVICFDMTLSITRFRWAAGSSQLTKQEENRRMLFYGVFAWGSALIPAVVALILEYCPGIPEDFPLKPNYSRYHDGPNVVVNLYFFGIPLLTLFWNNVLFAYTTYKIVCIQRSTEIATRNQTNALRRKYFLFLQLYLLMGSPWFFGSLLACLNNLVILKACRLTQPILWLLMLATHKKLRQQLTSKLRCAKKRETNAT